MLRVGFYWRVNTSNSMSSIESDCFIDTDAFAKIVLHKCIYQCTVCPIIKEVGLIIKTFH